MDKLTFEQQNQNLKNLQEIHAIELSEAGIAERALLRRSDEEWYSDTAKFVPSPDSLPVVMIDTSSDEQNELYVFFKRTASDGSISGEEVNIAAVTNPGTRSERVKPHQGFTIDDAEIVKFLADELIQKRETRFPDLSDDLLGVLDRSYSN